MRQTTAHGSTDDYPDQAPFNTLLTQLRPELLPDPVFNLILLRNSKSLPQLLQIFSNSQRSGRPSGESQVEMWKEKASVLME